MIIAVHTSSFLNTNGEIMQGFVCTSSVTDSTTSVQNIHSTTGSTRVPSQDYCQNWHVDYVMYRIEGQGQD